MVLVAPALTTSKSKVLVMGLQEVLQYILSNDVGYEVISSFATPMIKPFFDIDFYGDVDSHDSVLGQCVKQICEWFDVTKDELAISNTVYPDQPEKLSVHILVITYRIEYSRFMRWARQDQVIIRFKELSIDSRIYTSYRKFRLLFCSKTSGGPIKKPVTFCKAG